MTIVSSPEFAIDNYHSNRNKQKKSYSSRRPKQRSSSILSSVTGKYLIMVCLVMTATRTTTRWQQQTLMRVEAFSTAPLSISKTRHQSRTAANLNHHRQQRRSFTSTLHNRNNNPGHRDGLLARIFESSSSSQLFSAPPNRKEVDPGVVEGTDLRIVKYPHPALRADNAEITVEELKESKDIADLSKGMLKIMYAAEGVGLAAPQVGVNKRLMVYNPSGDSKRWLDETVLVNPKIVEFSEAKDEEIEGCLSFPDMSGEVVRSKWIKVEAMNLKGKKLKKKYTGWEARIFQHEYDHLDGTVYIDRLSEETRSKVQPTLDDLVKEFGDGGSL